MPRYIDANKLWHEILIQCNKEITKYKTMRRALGNVGRVALDCVETAPTIDAVKVVRCRECKHWTPLRNFIEVGNCDRFVSACTPGSFFCADGKRKMDAEVE